MFQPAATLPVQRVAQYPTGPSAEQELASLRHDAEMERMRSEHTLEMEKLRNEMRMLRTAGPAMGQGQPMGNAWMAPGPGIQQAGGALSALSSRLMALESNYTQREAELNSLGAPRGHPRLPTRCTAHRCACAAANAARMPAAMGMQQQAMGAQGQASALALSAKNAEMAAMQQELGDLMREVETLSGGRAAVRY